ncbi:MAG: hypothetical protein E4G96_09910 [Chrysiogenales bacterium]|nr:MAG: hypothetical protein E4G96_09910 [Chrysiogenales bacterium]
MKEGFIRIIDALRVFEERHPYIFSAVPSLVIIFFSLFFNFYAGPSDHDRIESDELQILDMDTISAFAVPKRFTKKDYSTDRGEAASEESEETVQRATGESEDGAVDLSFYPNIVPPRLLGRIEQRYPKIARELQVEAVVMVELLIGASGKVLSIGIIGIRLMKDLPPDLKERVASQFNNDARLMLQGARYSPPVVDGKNIPVKMEERLIFRLE